MTNTTTVNALYPIGDRYLADVTVDITSLDSAGTEPWVPDDEIDGLDNVDVVIVGSQEVEANRITYDHVNQQFDAVAVADGANATGDVGEVELVAIGVR